MSVEQTLTSAAQEVLAGRDFSEASDEEIIQTLNATETAMHEVLENFPDLNREQKSEAMNTVMNEIRRVMAEGGSLSGASESISRSISNSATTGNPSAGATQTPSAAAPSAAAPSSSSNGGFGSTTTISIISFSSICCLILLLFFMSKR